MSGFLPATFALVLALAAAVILCAACGRPVRKRRAAAGLLLLVASGLCLWVLWGSAVPQPRAVAIVFSQHAKPEDLHLAASSLQNWDRVTWLLMTRSPPDRPSAAQDWMSAAAARLQAGENADAYRQRVLASAQAVVAEPDDWLMPILRADRSARQHPLIAASTFYHDTLLFLHDSGSDWAALSPRGAPLINADDRPSALVELRRRPTDVFLLPAPSRERAGRLEIDLDPTVLPAVLVGNLRSARAYLRLSGARSIRQKDAVYKVRAWIDDEAKDGWNLAKELTVKDTDPDAPILSDGIELASFKPEGKLLDEGFHRLLVNLSIPVMRNGIASHVEYQATRYIKAETRTMVVVHPDGAGTLAAREPEKVFGKVLEKANVQRTSLANENVRYLAIKDMAAVKNALNKCRALVLIEPSPASLQELDEAGIEGRIKEGLSVLVVGAPTRPSNGKLPTWLPVAAKPVDENSSVPLRVYRERRLYFVPDNARLMRFPAWDDLGAQTDLTVLRAQASIINKICADFGITDKLAEVGTDKVNDFVTGALHTRNGALTDGTPLTVFPPLSNYLKLDTPNQVAQAGPQWLLETAASLLPTRLRLLERAIPAIANFEPIETPHLYPGSAVVLFMANLPQPDVVAISNDLKNMIETRLQPVVAGTAPSVVADAEALTRLAKQAVTVYVVRIDLRNSHRESLQASFDRQGAKSLDPHITYVDRTRQNPDLAKFIVDVGTVDFSRGQQEAKESWEKVAKDLTRLLRDHDTGRMVRMRGGRVMDERTKSERAMPGRHLLLEPRRPVSPLEPYHAELRGGPALPPDFKEANWPALVARSHGEGHVVVSAYSPFADDVWHSDADPDEARMDGWGVQRLIDLFDLTAPRRRAPTKHPIVRGITEADDGATIRVDCWALFDEGRWDEPYLKDDRTRREIKGRTIDVDRLTQSISFEFRNTQPEALRGAGVRLVLAKDKTAEEAAPRLYVNLRPSTEAGRSVQEALARLARLSGGAEISSATAADTLRFHRPAPWFGGFALVLVALALFAPPLRAWALGRRWRRSGDPALKDVQPTANFDIDAVLVEWGLNVGDPRAARQAGLPGGQKPFESGDALSMAKPASLFGLTSAGNQVLPVSKPVLRRRHVTHAMEGVLLLDCTASLLVPARKPGKAEYVELMSRLVAAAVWSRAGSIQVRCVQDRALVWGPRSAGDDADELAHFVHEALGRGAARPWGKMVLPEDLVPGHVLFVISDLLAPRAHDLPGMLDYLAAEGIDFRLAHLIGASDQQMFGLGRSALSGLLLDRGEWDEADMAAAIERYAASMRHIVEAGAGRFASVSTDLTAGDLFGRLVAQEFFQ